MCSSLEGFETTDLAAQVLETIEDQLHAKQSHHWQVKEPPFWWFREANRGNPPCREVYTKATQVFTDHRCACRRTCFLPRFAFWETRFGPRFKKTEWALQGRPRQLASFRLEISSEPWHEQRASGTQQIPSIHNMASNTAQNTQLKPNQHKVCFSTRCFSISFHQDYLQLVVWSPVWFSGEGSSIHLPKDLRKEIYHNHKTQLILHVFPPLVSPQI